MEILNEKPKSLEFIVAFLNQLGIETSVFNPKEVGFDREVLFTINDFSYIIEWWDNQCYLRGVNSDTTLFILPFKYVDIDTSYPVQGKWIKFSDIKYKTNSMWDNQYPFGLLRIKFK